MRWAHPQWLFGIFLVWGLFLFLLRDLKRKDALLASFISPAFWDRLIPERDPAARKRKLFVWSVALSFLFLALARPQGSSQEQLVPVKGLDISIALDLSRSMDVEDLPPSRLGRAKYFLRTLADRLDGNRLSLVAFAGSSFLACPLTTDIPYFLEMLDLQSSDSIVQQGSDIGLALTTVAQSFERGAVETTPQSARADLSSKILLLITDGEDLEGRVDEGIAALKKMDVKVLVLGVGTEKGGPIPVRDDDGILRGYKRENGKDVISRADPQALEKIASALGGKMWMLSQNGSELDEVYQAISSMEADGKGERKIMIYEERFQYPLLFAIFLLILELSLRLRRPWRVAWMFLFLLPAAYAGEDAPLNAYLENKKGLEAFEAGRMPEARRNFGAAQSQDPDRAEFLFNQGVMQIEEKEFEKAAKTFQKAAEKTPQESPQIAGKSYYNEGASWAQAKKNPEAIAAYIASIDAAKRAQDANLEAEARQKLAELVQQQKSGGGGGGSDNQEKKQEGDQSDPNHSQQEQKPSGYKQSQKQQFKSQNLSKEDADRVMEELSGREKQIQKRLGKKKSSSRDSGRKDW